MIIVFDIRQIKQPRHCIMRLTPVLFCHLPLVFFYGKLENITRRERKFKSQEVKQLLLTLVLSIATIIRMP